MVESIVVCVERNIDLVSQSMLSSHGLACGKTFMFVTEQQRCALNLLKIKLLGQSVEELVSEERSRDLILMNDQKREIQHGGNGGQNGRHSIHHRHPHSPGETRAGPGHEEDLLELLQSPSGFRSFLVFVKSEFSEENVLFWNNCRIMAAQLPKLLKLAMWAHQQSEVELMEVATTQLSLSLSLSLSLCLCLLSLSASVSCLSLYQS